MKNKKYKTMNAIENGNTVDFWEYYYRNEFKNNVAFYGAGKKDYIQELNKHYMELSEHKQIATQALLNQLTAIENILNECSVAV